ncbi:hypothetical protein QJS10_CPA03g01345 [Acorus calamus]|uniref:Uncharacterized protein n=1 Tax=Acorus calamus TaxID=4465 RepID=A0AAV9FBV8_ACOCL|nr:hypothetical protein QJS10_CPA03g01345 [Acorus calamus]
MELRAREQKIILSPTKAVQDSTEMTIDQIFREGTSMIQKEMQSKFNRNLISCIGKKYLFYTKENKITTNDKAMGHWIAQYVEHIDEVEDGDIKKNDGGRNKRKKIE